MIPLLGWVLGESSLIEKTTWNGKGYTAPKEKPGTLMGSVSRSLDLTGSDWGLRKKTKRQTYRKAWDRVGPTILMRHAGDPLCLRRHSLIQQVWESRGEVQVEFARVQSRRRQEQRSCGMLFAADYPDYLNTLFS
jgi:hypothetical protein